MGPPDPLVTSSLRLVLSVSDAADDQQHTATAHALRRANALVAQRLYSLVFGSTARATALFDGSPTLVQQLRGQYILPSDSLLHCSNYYIMDYSTIALRPSHSGSMMLSHLNDTDEYAARQRFGASAEDLAYDVSPISHDSYRDRSYDASSYLL